jgi:hypothetical protein
MSIPNFDPLSALDGGLSTPNPQIQQSSTLPVSGMTVLPPDMTGVPLTQPPNQISDQQAAGIQQAANTWPSYAPLPQIMDLNGVPLSLNPNPSDVGSDLIINPTAMNTLATPGITNDYDNNITSYTGSDLRLIVDVVDAFRPWPTSTKLTKQLIECTTITVSVHREKDAVRACSFINPKGFARGKRTIAGTLILTQFTVDVLLRFLGATLWNDTSKDSGYVKVDQLPPMDFTMVFGNEQGQCSYRRLLGVDFLTDGTIYSMNDAMTEQTISFVAADFTPLLPFNLKCLSNNIRPSASAQLTPGDLIRANTQNSSNTIQNNTNVKPIESVIGQ